MNGGEKAVSYERKLSKAVMSIYGINEEAAVDKDSKEQDIPSVSKNSEININLNRDNLIQGIILSEILGNTAARTAWAPDRPHAGLGHRVTERDCVIRAFLWYNGS